MPEISATYNLLLHENELVNPLSQNPSTARRLSNFIPTKAGELRRKEYAPPFSVDPTALYWFTFAREYSFYVSGTPTRQIIVGVGNNLATFLYKWSSGGALTALPAGAFSPPHNPGAGWVGDPLMLYDNGLLYISDGEANSNWTVYDGANTWKGGMDVPAAPILQAIQAAAGVGTPAFTGAGLNDLGVSGTFTGVPWEQGPSVTFEIEIESTGTPDKFKWRRNITGGATGTYTTGVGITTGEQYLRNGLSIKFAASTGHTVGDKWTITAEGLYIENYVEYVLTEYDSTRKRESAPGARLRVNAPGAGYYKIFLDSPARLNTQAGWTAGAADKFRLYRSLLDGSTQMYRLKELTANDFIVGTAFSDTSPFYGDDDYELYPLEPPFRNQKPKPSRVGVKFHNRFAIRDEDRRSRLWVTGAREILAQGSYSPPLETVPGVRNQALVESGDEKKLHNVSDYENYVDLTNEAFEVRAMLAYRAGVLLGTELDIVVMTGRNPEDPYEVSNTTTYKFGVFHKNSFYVTTHGLVIFTADRRLVLDPAFGAGGDRTDQVIDIGWPKQLEFDKTDMRFSNRFEMVQYNYGRDRDWLVVAYTTEVGGLARLLVYDFQVQGWISFDDVRATCVGVVRDTEQGFQFLVAGGSVDGGSGGAGEDRRLRVVTGYSSSGAYANAAARLGLPAAGTEVRPANLYRTALLDLGSPEAWHVWQSIQYYKSVGTPDVTVKFWGDPADIDNLGAPDQTLTFTQLTSGAFEGFVHSHQQAKRAVFQFEIAAGGADGALRGLELTALGGTPRARL